MKKRNNILRAFSLISPLLVANTSNAESFFEDIMAIQKNMMHKIQHELEEMETFFSQKIPKETKNLTTDATLDISAHETDTDFLIHIDFKNASLKDGTCNVEFEQGPQGNQLMRVIWEPKIKLDEAKKTDTTKDAEIKAFNTAVYSSSSYNSQSRTHITATNENGSLKIIGTYYLPTHISTKNPIIKTDYENNSVEISLEKENTVQRFSITK